MQLQYSPNRWSCLPTAFAMVLDIPVSEIIANVGHDGSEIVWPDNPEPLCRRGFHIQEMIFVCYYKGHMVTPFESLPSIVSGGGKPVDVDFKMSVNERMKYLMQFEHGVLTGITSNGTPHAVAWNGELVYDTNGSIYEACHFRLDTFWLVR